MNRLAGAALALTLIGSAAAEQAVAAPPPVRHQRQVIRHQRQTIRHNRTVIRRQHAIARRWRTGQRLPAGYFGPQYYVNDWQARRLPAPRPGYRWIRRDNEYLMIAAATGLIATAIAASQ